MRTHAVQPEAERLIFSVLRDLASRARELELQARAYKGELSRLIGSLDPTLLDEPGIGPISAAKLIVCDPARLKGEAAFARCNGTAPKPASSGQTSRHRLSRGGDRQANNALHTLALSRSIHDERTRAYLERRTGEGKTGREAMRALKRHLSRGLYKRLVSVPLSTAVEPPALPPQYKAALGAEASSRAPRLGIPPEGAMVDPSSSQVPTRPGRRHKFTSPPVF